MLPQIDDAAITGEAFLYTLVFPRVLSCALVYPPCVRSITLTLTLMRNGHSLWFSEKSYPRISMAWA